MIQRYKSQKPQTKEHSTQLKHDCQMKITVIYLLTYLGEQENTEQKTA